MALPLSRKRLLPLATRRTTPSSTSALLHASSRPFVCPPLYTRSYAQSSLNIGPQLGSQNQLDMRDDAPDPNDGDKHDGSKGGRGGGGGPEPPRSIWRSSAMESMLATAAGIAFLTISGLLYHEMYKKNVA